MSRQSEIRISNLINAGLGEIKKAVNPHRYRLTALFVARLEGFEPPASSLGGTHSIRLSYKRMGEKSISNCSEKRLYHFPLRRLVLYPAELQGHI